MNAIINASEEILIFSVNRNILHIGAIMAAFFDDKPLIEGIDEDWDEQTTGRQIMRPEWDFSPIRMETMHHLPHIFFDTQRPERPDCPVLIPSSFARTRDRVISQDIYSCNELGGNMARFTQFPIMITRSTIIYEIISPGAAGSSIYV